MVKEEPEWGECGVSAAAAAEDLYAGHEVKDDFIFGPELIQQQDVAFSMENALSRTEEYQCRLKVEGGADAATECTHTCLEFEPGCNGTTEQLHGLRTCYVRLERLPVGDLHSYCYMLSQAAEDACKLQPAGEAAPATESTRAQAVYITREQAHTGQKPHSYDVYHKRYPQSHPQISYTSGKPYSCNTYTKLFTDKPKLTDHKRRQRRTRKNPYSCYICKKRFTQQSHFTTHMRIHTGEKPHSCDICNRRFTDKSALIQHIRIHTGEKPFSCSICRKRFAKRSNLTIHIRTHTGEKPYSCDICNKRFADRSTLNSHIRSHTGVKSYGCGMCTKRFTRRSRMNKHLRTHS